MELTGLDLGVLVGGIVLIGLIYIYFFGSKNEDVVAEMKDKTQVVLITVDAAYIPSTVKLRVNIPVEIVFDRRDKGECTEWVIFEKLPTKEGKAIKAKLPEGEKTIVRFTPTEIGEYDFACGMGMVHGKLVVTK